ncbi:hypothetical protein SDC9_161042 [bioreactor metagenome]|uniref:Uncharacterized protein n=1 Tax=bioreactor metagenome TaxID=1076179 RepID=A0A645FH45_9ZZZZ
MIENSNSITALKAIGVIRATVCIGNDFVKNKYFCGHLSKMLRNSPMRYPCSESIRNLLGPKSQTAAIPDMCLRRRITHNRVDEHFVHFDNKRLRNRQTQICSQHGSDRFDSKILLSLNTLCRKFGDNLNIVTAVSVFTSNEARFRLPFAHFSLKARSQ